MNYRLFSPILALGLAGAASAVIVDAEPNNGPTFASTINRTGSGLFADIGNANLELQGSDWFKIRLNENDIITAITTPLEANFSPDTIMALIDPFGTSVLISSDDDGTDIGDEHGSALRFQVPTTGDYFLAVAGYNSTYSDDEIEAYAGVTDSDQVGRYTLLVGVTPVPEPASVAALGLGALALVRRRRAR